MKITTASVHPEFTPVKVEITLETQAELNALGSLFNNSTVATALRDQGFEPREVWSNLRDMGADLNTPIAYRLKLLKD
jgi:hypothetical protein